VTEPDVDAGRGPDRRPSFRLDRSAGQRWTAAIAATLAAALLLFGGPTRHVVKVAAGAEPPATEGSVTAPAPPPTTPTGPPTTSRPANQPPLVGPDSNPSPTLARPPRRPQQPDAPRVVLAVRTGDDPLPGRDDSAIAAAMLAGSHVHATIVPLTGSPADCKALLRAGRVIVASIDPAASLAACIHRGGGVLVAFDERGLRPPSVSTRRPVPYAVADAAPVLRGKVGVVADAGIAGAVRAGVSLLSRAGVDVVTTRVVRDGATMGIDVNNGVRAFATAGVTTVLFAAPVDIQNVWVTQEQVLLPGVTHVVADVEDSIVDENYGPAFDGATAVTSQRGSWFARTHGQTRAQRACINRFGRTDSDPVPLSDAEAARVLVWCGELALVRQALAMVGPEVSLRFALRRPVNAPATSPLRVTKGRFGPSMVATVRWQLACRCWQEQAPFHPAAS